MFSKFTIDPSPPQTPRQKPFIFIPNTLCLWPLQIIFSGRLKDEPGVQGL